MLTRPPVSVPSSYDELFRRDGPYIGRLTRKYLGPQASPQDVEDVVQYVAEKVFSRGVLGMYDGSHSSNARWLTFLTRQVELYCRGQRQAMALRAWREPVKCDAPAGESGTSWAELYGGAKWDVYPSLSDSDLVARLREYLESASSSSWAGQVSLVSLFDLMVERVSAGESLTAPAVAAELGLPPAAARSALAVLKRLLRAACQRPVSVGGVKNVTREELAAAIEALEGRKSTAVRQTLARAGSRLADMDYHLVASQEQVKYPELLAEPSGTRQKHHGRVKAAVLHRLRALLAELSPPVPAKPEYSATPIPVVLPKPGQVKLHVLPQVQEPPLSAEERLEAELWHLGASRQVVDKCMALAREAFAS